MKIYLASTITERHQGDVLSKKKGICASIELLVYKGKKDKHCLITLKQAGIRNENLHSSNRPRQRKL